MNILIIISFILIFASSMVFLYPKRVALRIAGINKYDIETTPAKFLVLVYIVSTLTMLVFTALLIFELKDITDPLPAFLEEFFEWLNV